MKMKMMLCILCIYIIYTIYSPQYLDIFNSKKCLYICNTYIEIDDIIPFQTIKNHIKQKITLIHLFKDKDKDNIYLLNSYKNLEFYKLNNNKYRFLIYYYSSKTVICFQNHRSLCGGQERIWKIINHILDSPIKMNKIHYKKKLSIFTDFIRYNPIMYHSNYYPSNKNIKIFSKKYKKTLSLNEINILCSSYKCSKNDLVIGIVCNYIINQNIVQNKNIKIFVPINLDNEYGNIILYIPNKKTSFIQLIDIIKSITIRTIKNYYIKKMSIITNKLLTNIIPSTIFSTFYNNCMDSIHVFISNVKGFENNRTFYNYRVQNIYQFYNSYSNTIQVGISSYNKTFTITIHY